MKKFIEKIKAAYNKFVAAVGVDRICHFAICALVVAYAIPYGHICTIISFSVTFALALAKEFIIDGKIDFWDILADWIGGLTSLFMYAVAANLFNLVK